MATISKTIGTIARDYSTMTLWEADLDDGTSAANDATAYSSGDDAIGEVYNDTAFDEQVAIDGGSTVGLNSITLTVHADERHDGTAGTGARIVRTANNPLILPSTTVTLTVEWLELDSNGNQAGGSGIMGHNVQRAWLYSKIIAHGATGGSNNNGLVQTSSGGLETWMNCFVYDVDSPNTGSATRGISINTNRDATIYNCSIIKIVQSTGAAPGRIAYGIRAGDRAGTTVQNNAVGLISANQAGSEDYHSNIQSPSNATVDHNLSEDSTATGTGSLTGKDPANQFTSTADGTEDLHLIPGADAIDAGTDLGTTPTGVNIDIDNRDRDAEADTWDMGAHELVAEVSFVPIVMWW